MQLSDEQFALLNDYVEQTLDDGDRAKVEALLEQHPQLHGVIEAMRQDQAALVSLGREGLGFDQAQMNLASAAMDQVEHEDANPIAGRIESATGSRSRKFLHVLGGLSVAAAVLIVGGVVFQFFNTSFVPTRQPVSHGVEFAEAQRPGSSYLADDVIPEHGPAMPLAANERESTMASVEVADTLSVSGAVQADAALAMDSEAPGLPAMARESRGLYEFRASSAPSRQVMQIVTAEPLDSNTRLNTWAVNNSGVEVLDQQLTSKRQARSSLRIREDQVPALINQLAMETQSATTHSRKQLGQSMADGTDALALSADRLERKMADESLGSRRDIDDPGAAKTLAERTRKDQAHPDIQSDKSIAGVNTRTQAEPTPSTESWQNYTWGTVLQNQLPLEPNRRLAMARDTAAIEIDVIFVSPDEALEGYLKKPAESVPDDAEATSP